MKRTAKVFWKIGVLLVALALTVLVAAGAWFGAVSYTHLDVYKRQVQVLTDEKWLSFVIEQVLSNALK